jgi:hypothetical protein
VLAYLLELGWRVAEEVWRFLWRLNVINKVTYAPHALTTAPTFYHKKRNAEKLRVSDLFLEKYFLNPV